MTYGYWNSVREECIGWECCTIGEKFDTLAEQFAERIAFEDDEYEVTYSELKAMVRSLSYGFLIHGLKKGDKVMVQLPNNISFVAVLLALTTIGSVPILILPAHRDMEIKGIMEIAEPKAYVCGLGLMNKEFSKRAELLWKERNMGDLFFTADKIKQLMNTAVDMLPEFDKPDYRDVALMLLSGGTTGIPKLIPRTHGDYIYCSKMLNNSCGWREGMVFLSVLPVAHNFALGAPGIIGTMQVGGKSILTEFAYPNEIFELIETKKVNAVSMVPTLVNTCVNYRKLLGDVKLDSLESLLVGGAVFTESDAKKALEAFPCRLIQIFGMAEGLCCTTNINDTIEDVISTQGRPCSQYDMIRIVDSDFNDVAPGEYGQLITRGPYTITEYYRLPDGTSFTNDGWFCTGDRARMTRSGNIQVVGRIKEIINRAGEKIIPSVIEEILCSDKDIRAAAVIGKPDQILGSKICAFIITDKKFTLHEIKKMMTDRGVAEYRHPDEVYCLSEFPLTAVGKVDKNKLLNKYT